MKVFTIVFAVIFAIFSLSEFIRGNILIGALEMLIALHYAKDYKDIKEKEAV